MHPLAPATPQNLNAFPFLTRACAFWKQLSGVIYISCRRIPVIFICFFWHNSGYSRLISSYAVSSWTDIKKKEKTCIEERSNHIKYIAAKMWWNFYEKYPQRGWTCSNIMPMFLFDNSVEEDSRQYKVGESTLSSTIFARLHSICMHTIWYNNQWKEISLNRKLLNTYKRYVMIP